MSNLGPLREIVTDGIILTHASLTQANKKKGAKDEKRVLKETLDRLYKIEKEISRLKHERHT